MTFLGEGLGLDLLIFGLLVNVCLLLPQMLMIIIQDPSLLLVLRWVLWSIWYLSQKNVDKTTTCTVKMNLLYLIN